MAERLVEEVFSALDEQTLTVPGTEAAALIESMTNRDQSRSPWTPRSSRMTQWRRAQTRSLLQWAKRR